MHITIKLFVSFEFHSLGYGSARIGWVRAFWPSTAQLEAPRRWSICSSSTDVAPIARNRDSPWMRLCWTVTFQASFPSKHHKQIERMRNGVQCNKKFENWWRFGEVWWSFVPMVFLMKMERIAIVQIQSWEKCVLLWLWSDYEYIHPLNHALIHLINNLEC